MESYNIISKFEETQIPIQIIQLKDSYFIYVGTTGFQFNNLNISISQDIENSSTCTILDEEYSEIGRSLSHKLSLKFKCPIYLSFNISDESVTLNRGLYFTIEKDIFDVITTLNKNNL